MSAANSKKKFSPGRGSSKDYTVEECCYFLRLALTHPPIGSREWDFLAEEHSKHDLYKEYQRSGKKLQRKYHDLTKAKAPTGSTEMDEHITLANELKKAIAARALISKGHEELDLTKNATAVDSDTTDDDEIEAKNDNTKPSSNAEKFHPIAISEAPKKKKQKTASIEPSSIFQTGSLFGSNKKGNQTLGQEFIQLTMMQMQEDRRREQEREKKEECRRHEEREEAARIRREEKEEAAWVRREEREEERKNRELFMQMFMMAMGTYNHNQANHSNSTNNNNGQEK